MIRACAPLRFGFSRITDAPEASTAYVIYESTDWSTDKDSGADPPPGTKWLREKSDFYSKFFAYGVSRYPRAGCRGPRRRQGRVKKNTHSKH